MRFAISTWTHYNKDIFVVDFVRGFLPKDAKIYVGRGNSLSGLDRSTKQVMNGLIYQNKSPIESPKSQENNVTRHRYTIKKQFGFDLYILFVAQIEINSSFLLSTQTCPSRTSGQIVRPFFLSLHYTTLLLYHSQLQHDSLEFSPVANCA